MGTVIAFQRRYVGRPRPTYRRHPGPDVPDREPWRTMPHQWHRLVAAGELVIAPEPDAPGYWLVYAVGDVTAGHHLADLTHRQLADLAAAGVPIRDRAGHARHPARWSAARHDPALAAPR